MKSGAHSRLEYMRAWRAANREHVREYARLWNASRYVEPEFKARSQRRSRAWKQQNPARYKQTKRAKLLKNYGLTEAEYAAMHDAQKGLCKLCGKPETCRMGRSGGKLKPLSVDHCHATGRVRGLLCNNCNRGLGLLGDHLEALRTAVRYLEAA